jgi:hypothetical protein
VKSEYDHQKSWRGSRAGDKVTDTTSVSDSGSKRRI